MQTDADPLSNLWVFDGLDILLASPQTEVGSFCINFGDRSLLCTVFGYR